MRILLIHPPKTHQVWAGVPSVFNDKYAYLFPPLALMSLSAWLKRHSRHEVHTLDCIVDDLDFDAIERHVGDLRPDVVGVSATASHNMVNVARCIDAVKRALPDVFVVMGGPHVNAFPHLGARLRGVDACIQGDGEQPLVTLLDTLEAGGDIHDVPSILIQEDDGTVFEGEKGDPIHDLDTLPLPDRDDFPPGKYFTPGMRGARTTTMMSSRGCPHRCVFCNVPKAYRPHSPERVVEEMAEAAHRHGIQDIHFVDDLFNPTPERVMAISELILQRGLKIWWGYKGSIRQTTPEMIRLAHRAGCYRMHYGVETFTNEGLKALNKKATVAEIKEVFRMTQAEGVKAIAYMIMGNPHETSAQQILDVIPFMHDLSPDYVVYSLFTPYPDAPIFQDGVDRGLWPADCWEKFLLDPHEDYDLPTAWEEHLTKEELLELFKLVNRKFYFHPRTLLRTFARIRTRAELKNILLGGFQLGRMELLKASQSKI